MRITDLQRNKIAKLCDSHHVKSLFAFGSVLSGRFSKDSDIDLLVNFGDVALLEYADNYFSLKSELERLFKREVDLLEENAIRNPYFKSGIDRQKQMIYEK